MNDIAARQVHLDFHTSEYLTNIGQCFSKVDFQNKIKLGNLNSITVFGKCHHSWCYYPSKIGKIHPGLDFDLLGEMIDAAHDIGVKAPVYITVGWSAGDAENHPEWTVRNKEGCIECINMKLNSDSREKKPIVSWKYLCTGSGYEEHIYELTREICERYRTLDGIFYDITAGPICWCKECIKQMKHMGLDPNNNKDAEKYNVIKWQKFMNTCRNIITAIHKDATLFFNGVAEPSKTYWEEYVTHFEMEDLPTTWGGYDKLPLWARYYANKGKSMLGMTGKFHTMWGEFGGFKKAEALKYECAVMAAYGARCSVGDQMHPCGKLDSETYRLIGEAYKYIETIEPWCFDSNPVSRLGILMSHDMCSNEGIVRILLEKQLDFRVVTETGSFEDFDVIILPDNVLLNEEMAEKLNKFVEGGGGLLLTGKSGLNYGLKYFMLDVGAKYIGQSYYESDYVLVTEHLDRDMVQSPLLFYEGANITRLIDGVTLSKIYEPYFNRTYGQYTSHQNTPYDLIHAEYPGALQKGRIVYLAHPLGKLYFEHGAYYHKQYFINALDLIYKNPVVSVDMPSCGRVSLMHQENKKRYILHLLYAAPLQRGRTLVIEDIVPLYGIKVKLNVTDAIKRVYLAPTIQELQYIKDDTGITFSVPEVKGHQIVVLEY